MMENLITLSEQSAESSVEEHIVEKKFVEFMRECPIWTFYKISQSSYISKAHEEKVRLITEYYKLMSKDNWTFFVVCYLFV